MKPLLPEVRAAIVKACPEIMELKFGCEIYREGAHKRELVCGLFADEVALVRMDENGAWMPFEISKPPKSQEWKVIGRPIRLSDVLRAVGKSSENSPYVRHDGVFFLWERFTEGGRGHHGVESTYVRWNLVSDSLDDQSEETIAFVHKILCV